MSEAKAKQKAVLSAEVPEPGIINVTVDGAKKYYVQALACLCLFVSKKLDRPIPQLLCDVALHFWGSCAVESIPHRILKEDDAHE